MFIVLEEYYQLIYSESYIGNVYGEFIIEGYQYCMGLKRVFELLILERYWLFILIVGCIVVGIKYCVDNGYFKVFN